MNKVWFKFLFWYFVLFLVFSILITWSGECIFLALYLSQFKSDLLDCSKLEKFFGFPWRGLVKVETLTLFLINNFKRLRIKIEFLLCKIPSFPKSWTFHFLNNPLTIHPILIVAVAKRFLSRIKIHDVIIRWLTFIGKIIRLLLRLGRKLWGHANEGSRL